MKPIKMILFIVALLLTPFAAFAMAGTDEIARAGRPVPESTNWPAGVYRMVNDGFRTVGWKPWFSEWPNDVSYYEYKVNRLSDINEILATFGAIDATKLQVRLSPLKEAGTIGFVGEPNMGKDVAVVFSIGDQRMIDDWFNRLQRNTNGVRIFGAYRFTKPPEATPPTLTIYAGHRLVALESLEIPTNAIVVSDITAAYRAEHKSDPVVRDIDEFIWDRQSPLRPACIGEGGLIFALTRGERVALVKEAEQAYQDFVHSDVRITGTNLPPELWGPLTRRLKPVRVTDDRANIKIILKDGARESGFYINQVISSYAPQAKDFVEFTKLTEAGDGSMGTIFKYTMQH